MGKFKILVPLSVLVVVALGSCGIGQKSPSKTVPTTPVTAATGSTSSVTANIPPRLDQQFASNLIKTYQKTKYGIDSNYVVSDYIVEKLEEQDSSHVLGSFSETNPKTGSTDGGWFLAAFENGNWRILGAYAGMDISCSEVMDHGFTLAFLKSQQIGCPGMNIESMGASVSQNFSSGTIDNIVASGSDNGIYQNNELGIKFPYSSDEFKGKLITQGNKVIYNYPNGQANDLLKNSEYIEVFTKPNNKNIEEAILDIVQGAVKDPKNCKVVNKGAYYANASYNEYIVDLANPNITYSKQELNEIKVAEEQAKKDNGPFGGDWKKRDIYNKRLIENCSKYADPLGLGTSKTMPSMFIYDNRTKIVFLPGLANKSFYDENSLELLKGSN